MSAKRTANRTVHLSEWTAHLKSVDAITLHPDRSNQQTTFHRNVDDSFPRSGQTFCTSFIVSALAMNLKVSCPV